MIYAGILAAGVGTRMHRQDMPKQFLPLGEKPILINTLEQFCVNPQIGRIIVVVPEEWKLFTEDLISKYDMMGAETDVITGGKNKTLSVNKLVEYIRSKWGIQEDDILLAHDGVRPFVTQRIINDNIEAAKVHGMAATVAVTTDTIVATDDGNTLSSVPMKQTMYAEQTPLAFTLHTISEMFDHAASKGIALEDETELARMCIKLGYEIHIVEGESYNMKIITPYDLKVANALLMEKKL